MSYGKGVKDLKYSDVKQNKKTSFSKSYHSEKERREMNILRVGEYYQLDP